jgi:hypothetical protein
VAHTTYLVIRTKKNTDLHMKEGVEKNSLTLPVDKILDMFIKNEQPFFIKLIL